MSTDPTDLHPETPDPSALRRRVLLAGAVSLSLYMVIAFALAWSGAPDVYLIAAVVLLYAFVVRPLMRPVREASQLRRRLAYQAYLEQRDAEDDRG